MYMKLTRLFYFYLVIFLIGSINSCSPVSKVTSVDNKPGSDGTIIIGGATKPKFLPVYKQEEFNAGAVSGDNQQYMTSFGYCESDPDRIYQVQDMGGIWVSKDAGKNWNTLRNEGLNTAFIQSVEVDPLNPNRVIALVHCRPYDRIHQAYQGMYLSTDGGIHWEKTGTRSNIVEIRATTKLIAYAPSSKDQAKGYATRWYTVVGENNKSTYSTDHGFLYSADAGKSWNEVRKLPAAEFGGIIYGAKVHPNDAERVFVFGKGGLIRFDDATKISGSYEKLSGKNGLPAGTIYGNLHISPDGLTLIVAVANKGIYKSIDGGGNWTAVYGWDNIQKCFVNPSYPERIYATALRSSQEQIRVSKDGGVTFNTHVNSKPVPGYSGNWNTLINGEFCWLIPDPRNPDKAFVQGNAKHHRTDDGGNQWYPSNGYFNGNQFAGLNFEQMFDPVNPERFFYFLIDVGVFYTQNKGKWFLEGELNPGSLGISNKICKGGAVHPDASTGIVLASVGGSSSGSLIRSADGGRTWNTVRSAGRPRHVVGFDQQNPNYCYQWRERSADGGITWEEMNTLPKGAIIAGISLSNGKVLYAMSPEFVNDIYRSTDQGSSWERVIQADIKLNSPNDPNLFTFRIHPKDPNIVFTTGGNGRLTKWDLNQPKGSQKTDLVVMENPETGSYISQLAIDRRFPDIMYAINYRYYNGKKLFRTVDGGKTWENIGNKFSNGSIAGMEVSPVTGELFISGANGTRVMPPPYAAKNTAYESTAVNDPYLDKAYTAQQKK